MNSNPPKDFEDLTLSPRYLREFAARIRFAEEFLGVPGRPFLLSGLLERTLLAAAVLEHRRGLIGQHAYMVLQGTRRGHHALAAMERYRLNLDGRTLLLVRVVDHLQGARMNAHRPSTYRWKPSATVSDRKGSGVVFGQAAVHVVDRRPKTTPDPVAPSCAGPGPDQNGYDWLESSAPDCTKTHRKIFWRSLSTAYCL